MIHTTNYSLDVITICGINVNEVKINWLWENCTCLKCLEELQKNGYDFKHKILTLQYQNDFDELLNE